MKKRIKLSLAVFLTMVFFLLCLAPAMAITIPDPLNIYSADPTELYARIIKGLLGFVGITALLAFVYAGFLFLTSTGNPEQVKKAKDTMIYAVIGITVAMTSYAILNFVFSTLETSTT